MGDAGREAVRTVAAGEVVAAQEPGGPRGPDASWLIVQRLDDLRRAQDDLRADMKALDAKIDAARAEQRAEISSVRAEIATLRNWSLGLLLLAILGLLAKPLIPGV